MAPRCSVIILNYNGKHFLDGCLGSLRTQTCNDFQTLLVDNGSQDGSAEYVAQNFPEVRVLALPENIGFCAGNNRGMADAISRGAESVLLLNNDTRVAPDFMEHMLAAGSQDTSIAVICPKIYFMEQPDRFWYAGGTFSLWTSRSRHLGWKEVDHGQFDQQRDITAATGCAMLVRTSAIEQVGRLREDFWAYCEDVEWTLRFLEQGYRVVYEPRSRIWHYDGGTTVGRGSASRRQYLSTRNLLRLGRHHVRWFQFPTFLLGFLVFHVGYYSCLRLLRRDYRAFWAIYQGIIHSFQPHAGEGPDPIEARSWIAHKTQS
ncbi:MAG TPA: glycosyltransferase family 2 protein [Terriglobales bacterium]|nr:glycosyltransferase family 2 protein [Terriglobales bacterium]